MKDVYRLARVAPPAARVCAFANELIELLLKGQRALCPSRNGTVDDYELQGNKLDVQLNWRKWDLLSFCPVCQWMTDLSCITM